MVLSRMAGHDYTEDQSAPSVEDCVAKVRALLDSETKFRKAGGKAGDER